MPPVLVNDNDSCVSWIPTDLIVKRASVDAIYHPSNKKRDAFALQTARDFREEFSARLEEAEQSDNDMDQQDVTWDYGQEDGRIGFGPGSTWQQMHD